MVEMWSLGFCENVQLLMWSSSRSLVSVVCPPLLWHSNSFPRRHNSASSADVESMVAACGFKSLDALIDATVPAAIRLPKPMDLGAYNQPRGESEHLAAFKCVHFPSSPSPGPGRVRILVRPLWMAPQSGWGMHGH